MLLESGTKKVPMIISCGFDVEKNEWKHCASVPRISSPIALAPLRIPRDIIKTCKVVT